HQECLLAYFSGKSVDEIYLDQPRGGLPGLKPGQLLRAKKAIFGFAEAARLFWLALREHLENHGWHMSRLEPALFYLRRDKKVIGVLVTHVDDIEGGVHPKYLDNAFYHPSRALEFATNHFKDFIFRGREVKQTPDGHIDISMRNYALSMKRVKMETYNSVAGEGGWIARQFRCDVAYEINGVVQRSKVGTCMADLVRLKQYVGMARRGADFRMSVDLSNGVIVHLADSGHANGSPDHNDIMRYRSVGGYFILVANSCILEGKPSRANVLAFHSGQTKRVCRSTLAAEASHLAEAVEAGDWLTVLLEEALTNEVNLKSWPEVIERRDRVYVTDAKSVLDYLEKDSHSTSTDKRMAIEGALLRETVKRPRAHVRWTDGIQNIADVLTKANADKEVLRQYLKVVIKAKTGNQKQDDRRDQAIRDAEKILEVGDMG
ncbi:RE1, partial [Symbiodinium sp. KB8]